jgi:hypothetical protein
MKLTETEVAEVAVLANKPQETVEDAARLDELMAKRRAPEPEVNTDPLALVVAALLVVAEAAGVPSHHPVLIAAKGLVVGT